MYENINKINKLNIKYNRYICNIFKNFRNKRYR